LQNANATRKSHGHGLLILLDAVRRHDGSGSRKVIVKMKRGSSAREFYRARRG
jgi:hypothetical protein